MTILLSTVYLRKLVAIDANVVVLVLKDSGLRVVDGSSHAGGDEHGENEDGGLHVVCDWTDGQRSTDVVAMDELVFIYDSTASMDHGVRGRARALLRDRHTRTAKVESAGGIALIHSTGVTYSNAL